MDKKQVMVVALLLVAIVLSTTSVMMNVSILNNVEISEAPAAPGNADISLIVGQTPANTGGVFNG